MKLERTKTVNVKQILAFTDPRAAVGAQISDEGVTAVNGKKVIPAGTPVGGDNSTFEDEKTVLKVTNNAADGAKTQGVLQFDVDVSNGTANGSVLIFGFVNEFRLDDKLTIVKEAKAALDGKVTFMKRNK